MSNITSTALDKRAFVGRPQGYPTKSFPNGDLVVHPSKWNRFHWSFDDKLKTRGKHVHKPITTTEAMALVSKMLADLGKVGK